jgi:hypothetical protein
MILIWAYFRLPECKGVSPSCQAVSSSTLTSPRRDRGRIGSLISCLRDEWQRRSLDRRLLMRRMRVRATSNRANLGCLGIIQYRILHAWYHYILILNLINRPLFLMLVDGLAATTVSLDQKQDTLSSTDTPLDSVPMPQHIPRLNGFVDHDQSEMAPELPPACMP